MCVCVCVHTHMYLWALPPESKEARISLKQGIFCLPPTPDPRSSVYLDKAHMTSACLTNRLTAGTEVIWNPSPPLPPSPRALSLASQEGLSQVMPPWIVSIACSVSHKALSLLASTQK